MIIWAWNMAHTTEERNAYRVLVWIPEGKRPLERFRQKWEDKIKMDLKETEWVNVDWHHLVMHKEK
jgi:hypothetical protein